MWLFWCHTQCTAALCAITLFSSIFPPKVTPKGHLCHQTPETKLALKHISSFATVKIPALSTPIHAAPSLLHNLDAKTLAQPHHHAHSQRV
jgi:hypothetical protein